MKLKASKKEFKGCNVLKVGYCNLQYLLYYKKAFAYSSGVYGWSCDYYNIDGVYISMGYSPIGKDIDYDIVKRYDDQARKIICNYDIDYEVRKDQVNKLLIEFLKEIKAYE